MATKNSSTTSKPDPVVLTSVVGTVLAERNPFVLAWRDVNAQWVRLRQLPDVLKLAAQERDKLLQRQAHYQRCMKPDDPEKGHALNTLR
jgi:hypothetical protein